MIAEKTIKHYVENSNLIDKTRYFFAFLLLIWDRFDNKGGVRLPGN